MDALFPSLFRHQAWADAALLTAIAAHPESLSDEWLLKTLHHIVAVQRFFLAQFLRRDFDTAKEFQAPATFAGLIALYQSTHAEELAFIDKASEDELERRFELAFLQTQPTIAEGLTQVALHSQNHRGQCLTRLRQNGAKPPALDFILWTKDRPAPAWPAA